MYTNIKKSISIFLLVCMVCSILVCTPVEAVGNNAEQNNNSRVVPPPDLDQPVIWDDTETTTNVIFTIEANGVRELLVSAVSNKSFTVEGLPDDVTKIYYSWNLSHILDPGYEHMASLPQTIKFGICYWEPDTINGGGRYVAVHYLTVDDEDFYGVDMGGICEIDVYLQEGVTYYTFIRNCSSEGLAYGQLTISYGFE